MKTIKQYFDGIFNSVISFYQRNKLNMTKGMKYLIVLIVTNILSVSITHIVTKKLERAGEPKITAIIESVVLYQNLSTNICEGEIVLNITNLENKPTYLTIDTILINISRADKRPFAIYIDKKSTINSYEIKNDTIRFDLPYENILGIDSFKCPDITCEMNIYYPNRKLASIAVFDTTAPKIDLIYGWEKIPSMAFYSLRNGYNNKLIPMEWKKTEVQYYGTVYDCYYYSEDSNEVVINYIGERLEYKYGNDKYYPITTDSNKIYDRFVFVPHPKIENKFINMDNRTIIISVQCRNGNKIDVVRKSIDIRRGYVQAYNIRY